MKPVDQRTAEDEAKRPAKLKAIADKKKQKEERRKALDKKG